MFGNMLIKYFIVNRSERKKAALCGAAHALQQAAVLRNGGLF